MQTHATIDRSKLRMERLKQLELEQLQWEQEALVMPEYLNRALFLSFESVKTEFSDLDGLSWSRYPVPLVTNPWAYEEPEPTPKLTCTEIGKFPNPPSTYDTRVPAYSPTHRPYQPQQPQLPPPPSLLPYALSSRTELAPFAPEDTIRASRLSHSSRGPLQPANQFFMPQFGASHKDPRSHGSGSPYTIPRSHPPSNIAMVCHSPLRPTNGHN